MMKSNKITTQNSSKQIFYCIKNIVKGETNITFLNFSFLNSVFSGPDILAFGLNTEIYRVNLHIQT